MDIKAILFDVNGTLIDISTDENHIGIFRKIRNFLQYNGIYVHKTELRDLYFKVLKEQKANVGSEHPEFDAEEVWRRILRSKQTSAFENLPAEYIKWLPTFLAKLYRSLTLCRKLQLYPGVIETLDVLKRSYKLGIVSNGQTHNGVNEMRTAGILDYFNPVIISGDYGYCKPNPLLFQKAIDKLKIAPENMIYVGNDMNNDVLGGHQVGMKTVFFISNQGDHKRCGVEPDYIIREFPELLGAVEHFKGIK